MCRTTKLLCKIIEDCNCVKKTYIYIKRPTFQAEMKAAEEQRKKEEEEERCKAAEKKREEKRLEREVRRVSYFMDKDVTAHEAVFPCE